MAMRRKKQKGAKRVSYELIDAKSVVGQPIYKLLRELVKSYHEHLVDARIALAWCTSWRPDVDGRVTLGKCKKASDLDRELSAHDFVILLRKSWWQDLTTTPAQRAALLDHELCHASVRCDERTGDPVLDERGRKVYRTRKHDWEEFTDVIARHGIYTRDMELAAAAILKAARAGWQPCDTCRDTPNPGWTADGSAANAPLKRCACWTTWQNRYAEAVAS